MGTGVMIGAGIFAPTGQVVELAGEWNTDHIYRRKTVPARPMNFRTRQPVPAIMMT